MDLAASVDIPNPLKDFEDIFVTIFSDDFKLFLVRIVREFDRKIDQIFVERSNRSKLLLERDQDESLETLAAFMEEHFSGDLLASAMLNAA